jgi:hypothetical protein
MGSSAQNAQYYKAIDVLRSAKVTFSDCGNQEYAIGKANTFLYRCGARLEDGPDQLLSVKCVKAVARAMLDTEAEESFFIALGMGDCK